jgi:adenosylcobinamide-phosphate synthase
MGVFEGAYMTFPYPLLIGFALDLLLGDPLWLPHPVIAIGKLIGALEKLL